MVKESFVTAMGGLLQEDLPFLSGYKELKLAADFQKTKPRVP